ncbi:MAG: Rrf2 family transcriptional regulator [Deltaproteobacteria bacterium]|nr:Rrf2 family transcriptional regulator [Deltaproteobacteria bacterium]MBW2420039.1 Rrf2 family transcriptional regulator [Deltaproteobacteria bacterium]
MHIFAIEEYGLRCLLQLAFHDPSAPMATQEIAEAEGLGPEYVAKIMRTLRAGGLVVSTRGAAGGYRLARPANEIGAWEAIEVLGGGLFPQSFCDCHPGRRRECVHATDCSIRAMWRKVEGPLKAALNAISLADLRRDETSMVTWLDTQIVPLIQ